MVDIDVEIETNQPVQANVDPIKIEAITITNRDGDPIDIDFVVADVSQASSEDQESVTPSDTLQDGESETYLEGTTYLSDGDPPYGIPEERNAELIVVVGVADEPREWREREIAVQPTARYEFNDDDGPVIKQPSDATVGEEVVWEFELFNDGSGSAAAPVKLDLDNREPIEESTAFRGNLNGASSPDYDSDLNADRVRFETVATPDMEGSVDWEAVVPNPIVPDPADPQRAGTTQSGSFTVDPAPKGPIRLSVDNDNSPLTPGDEPEISVGVVNETDESASRTVDLFVDGNEEDSVFVSLDGREETSVTLTADAVTPSDIGTLPFSVTVGGAGATRSGTLRVGGEPNLRLSVNGTNDPVEPGDTLRFEVGIENDSDEPQQDSIELRAPDGELLDDATASLSEQGDSAVSLSTVVGDEDIGEFEATIETAIQVSSRKTVARIVADRALDITDIDVPDTADIDDTVQWVVDVTSVAPRPIEETVAVALPDRGIVDEQSVALDPGETETVELSTRIRPPDLDDLIWTVTAAADERRGELDVFDPGPVSIESVSIDDAVDEGEPIDATVTLSSTESVSAPLRVFIFDDRRVRRKLQLEGRFGGFRGRKTVTVEIPTAPGEAADNVDVLFDVPGDQQTESVDIDSRRVFAITSLSSDGSTPPGDDVTVNVDLKNIGSRDGGRSILLTIDGGGTDSVITRLDSGESGSVSLSAAVPDEETITEATVTTATDTERISLVVREDVRRRIGDGWVAEIAVGEENIRPDVIADVAFQPGVGSVPEISIPVRQRDRWFDLDLPAPLRVWVDGDRVPIDELVDVRRERDRDVLVGRGAAPLREYREAIDIPDGRPADAVRSLLDTTALKADVDDFEESTRTDVPLRETDDEDAFRRRIVDEPGRLSMWDFVSENGDARPEPRQTAHFVPAPQEFDTGVDDAIVQDPRFHNGEAYEAISGAINDRIFNGGPVTLDYPLETGAVDKVDASVDEMAGIALRKRTPTELPGTFGGSAHPGFRISVSDSDGETLAAVQVPADALLQDDDPAWFTQRLGSGLPADEPLSIEIDFNRRSDEDDAKLQVGSVLLFDRRTRVRPSDDGVANDILQGVDLYPGRDDDVRVELRDAMSVETIDEATAIQTVSEPASGRLTAISTDRGKSFEEAADSDTATVTAGMSQRARSQHRLVGVENAGDATTPQGRNEPMRLESVTIEADLNDTPLLQDRHERGELQDVLQELASDTDAVWEVVWDPVERRQQVSWTWPGQREGDEVEGIVDIDVEKQSSTAAQRVVAFGAARSFEETIEVPARGESKRLDEGWVVPGSERVVDPDSGRRFVRGVDYAMDYNADRAALTVLEDSRLPEGKAIEVSYDAKARAEHIAQAFADADPDTLATAEIDNLSVQSEEAVAQIALVAAEDLAEPQFEAEIVLSDLDPTTSVLGGLSADLLPVDGPETVTGLDVDADQVVVRLSNRLSLSETLQSLRSEIAQQTDRL